MDGFVQDAPATERGEGGEVTDAGKEEGVPE